MLAKLCTLALIVPYVAAFSINPIEGATSGSPATISWTASTTDAQVISILLVNVAFHNTYAVANNVPTTEGSITITLPQLPAGDGYTVEAIDPSNINTVYSQSSDFSVSALTTTSGTATSTASSSSLSSATSSTSSGSLSILSSTSTTPVSLSSSPASSASTSTASSTPSALNSGAASFKLIGVAPAAALVLSAVAGAAMVF